MSKKVQESKLKWYGHVLRREEEYVGKRVMVIEVPGKIRRGKPKRKLLDNIRNDLSERELSGEERKTENEFTLLIVSLEKYRLNINLAGDYNLNLLKINNDEVVYRQLIITIFRMPIYPMLNKANDPEYWLLIGRESGQVSHEY